MATAEEFRAAASVCVEAYDKETAQEAKLHLARAAFLFAQLAEHIERGLALAPESVTACRDAVSTIHGSVRARVDVLLGGEFISAVREEQDSKTAPPRR